MHRQYYSLFRNRRLHHQHAKQCILSLFPQKYHYRLMNLDQMLFLFDQSALTDKVNRSITAQLFRQVQNIRHQTTLSDLVSKYLENLQTSKICIMRDEAKLTQLKDKVNQCEQRKKAFIYLKLISVTVFSQFTKQNSLKYRIMPTQIPPVSLNYGQYTLLNHDFVLEMEEPQFDLIFYQNGIQIMKWTFPDQPRLPEGQYMRNIQSQHLSFQAKIKYIPKGRQKQLAPLNQEIDKLETQLNRQFAAFEELCLYEPFLEKQIVQQKNEKQQWGCKNCWQQCCPWIKSEVKGIYYTTVFLMIFELGTSSIWPSQLLDIIALFFLLSVLSDPLRTQYASIASILQWILILLILKSIWGLVSPPTGQSTTITRALVILCILGKVLLIFLLFLLKGSDEQIRAQCDEHILGIVPKIQEQKAAEPPPALQYDIWDD